MPSPPMIVPAVRSIEFCDGRSAAQPVTDASRERPEREVDDQAQEQEDDAERQQLDDRRGASARHELRKKREVEQDHLGGSTGRRTSP